MHACASGHLPDLAALIAYVVHESHQLIVVATQLLAEATAKIDRIGCCFIGSTCSSIGKDQLMLSHTS